MDPFTFFLLLAAALVGVLIIKSGRRAPVQATQLQPRRELMSPEELVSVFRNQEIDGLIFHALPSNARGPYPTVRHNISSEHFVEIFEDYSGWGILVDGKPDSLQRIPFNLSQDEWWHMRLYLVMLVASMREILVLNLDDSIAWGILNSSRSYLFTAAQGWYVREWQSDAFVAFAITVMNSWKTQGSEGGGLFHRTDFYPFLWGEFERVLSSDEGLIEEEFEDD